MFSAIQNQNPFFLPLIALFAVWLARMYYFTRPGRMRKYVIMLTSGVVRKVVVALSVIALVGFVVFELYYVAFSCRVSSRYWDETKSTTLKTIKVLENRKLPWWPDYASLLAVLRKMDINSWDHDTDLSMMHPGPRELDTLLAQLRDKVDTAVDYEDRRELIQVWSRKQRGGPHVDIWLWRDEPSRKVDDRDIISTADALVTYRYRYKDEIFPLSTAIWLGANISIPREAYIVSEKEFANFGGDTTTHFMTPRVFRGDCFHNFFNLRWFY